MSAPAQIIRVCAGPELPFNQQGRVNISWDVLPCHLTNGANIRGYIIQYSHQSSDERSISTSDNSLKQACNLSNYNHRHSCLLPESSGLLQRGVRYIFRIAAQNTYGVGPFSDPVFGMIGMTSFVN